MVKLDREELRQISQEIDDILDGHREVLDHNPQISRPLTEARDLARTKYERISELPKPETTPL